MTSDFAVQLSIIPIAYLRPPIDGTAIGTNISKCTSWSALMGFRVLLRTGAFFAFDIEHGWQNIDRTIAVGECGIYGDWFIVAMNLSELGCTGLLCHSEAFFI